MNDATRQLVPVAVSPLGVGRALERLDDLEGQPVQAHVEIFDSVHRQLQDALATLDEA